MVRPVLAPNACVQLAASTADPAPAPGPTGTGTSAGPTDTGTPAGPTASAPGPTGTGSASDGAPAAESVLPCGGYIGADPPAAPLRTVLGVVALPAGPEHPALQTSTAGGYWLDHPACVALVVEAGGRRQEVRIGLGTACPGQRPPQGPSDR